MRFSNLNAVVEEGCEKGEREDVNKHCEGEFGDGDAV